MKKLYIALFDCSIYIYGNDERKRYEKEYNCSVGNDYGQANGNGVWIGEHDDVVGVCYHEASHLTDWVLESRLNITQGSLESNTELRAYFVEYIGNAIRKYVEKRRNEA